MRRWGALGLCLLLGCGVRTQALVEVEVEQELLAILVQVDVSPIGSDPAAENPAQSFVLTGDPLERSTFSFGAVPDASGRVALRFQGLDEDGDVVIEQTIEALLPPHKVTHLPMVLRTACLHQLPCDASTACALATGETAGDLPSACDATTPDADTPVPDAGTSPDAAAPPPEGDDGGSSEAGEACSSGSEACAACSACNGTHVQHFSQCIPLCRVERCEDGYGDCRKEQDDGCETNLNSDAQHCGGCEGEKSVCPYQVCSAGRCETRVEGSLNGAREVRWGANRMMGMRIAVSRDGTLAGLGIRLASGGGQPDARFRLGLYEAHGADQGQSPADLLDATAEMSLHGLERSWSGMVSEHGGLEMPVTRGRQLYRDKVYWIFLLASDYVDIMSNDVQTTWMVSSEEVPYVGVMSLPDNPIAYSFLTPQTKPRGALYVVTNPPQ
jgi:hypothetical protein